MTNESIPAPDWVPDSVEVEQPPITHKMQGISPYSMIDGLLAFQPDQYYNDAFKDSVRISGLRDQFMAGAGAELEQEKVAPPPITAYTNPQGEFVNPDPPPGAPPVQQQPPAAPQRPQGGQQRPPSGLLCTQHHTMLVESIAKYQEYDEVDGQQVPAKFFCPGDKNGTGANHSVWRSQAIPA